MFLANKYSLSLSHCQYCRSASDCLTDSLRNDLWINVSRGTLNLLTGSLKCSGPRWC